MNSEKESFRFSEVNEVYLLCHLITVHVNFLNLFGHPKNKIKTS